MSLGILDSLLVSVSFFSLYLFCLLSFLLLFFVFVLFQGLRVQHFNTKSKPVHILVQKQERK